MSDEEYIQIKPKAVKVYGISTIVALIPIAFGGFNVARDYNDERYVRVGETITIAAASEIQQELASAKRERKSTAVKLDRLLLQQARADTWSADDRLRSLVNGRADPEVIRQAEKNLEAAKEYYECIKSNGPQCDRLLGN